MNASCALSFVRPCFIFRIKSGVGGKRGRMNWRLKWREKKGSGVKKREGK